VHYDDAKAQVEGFVKPGTRTVYWGGLSIPEEWSENHFCVVGTTGSGKTVTIRLLMQSVLPLLATRKTSQALIYDAKRDTLSMLAKMGVTGDRVIIMNPLDRRAAAWDIANDIDQPALVDTLARNLIPEEEGPNRFFSDAARALLQGVLNALIINAPKSWTLRDVVLATQSEHALRAVLATNRYTESLISKYFEEKRTFFSVLSTVASNLSHYETLAALWHRSFLAKRTMSINEWLKGNKILILGNDDAVRAPLDTVNRLIFQRLGEMLLARNANEEQTWIILDEIKEAGRFPILSRLLTRGRTSGARLVLGFQDIEGFQHVYGDKPANEIVAMCGNRALLRAKDTTARWAAELIGSAQVIEPQHSFPIQDPSAGSVSLQMLQHQAVLADEIRTLPAPAKGVFDGYYIIPPVLPFACRIFCDNLLLNLGTADDFQPRPVSEQYLEPWNHEDLRRLRLPQNLASMSNEVQLPPSPPATLFDAMPRITRDHS